ncbi:sterol desaturase family protein [Aquabacterium sp.]|uniref:sterol desaturase family protein n=1 Tax=Aquabacterium sp. TaxID=1872578 RepID=UPI0024880146|nr:sterol desaturase family protein [Aquabacterium sp.]MDI1260635.1 sterol desaturase family protein [Aquabacterium sp.]
MTGVEAKHLITVIMAPVGLLALLLELWHYRGRQIFRASDACGNALLGGVAMVVEAAMYGLFVAGITSWCYEQRFATIPVNLWTVLLLAVLGDLCIYINHRLNHRVRLFWTAHALHHSSEFMNLTTAMRRSALTLFVGASWVTYLPLILIGFDPGWMMFVMAVNLIYQYFLHTQWVPKMHPVIEFIFNTPSHHRAHHARNACYIDRNYGGIFIVFDRMFGTFAEEVPNEPPEFGSLNHPDSSNPLWLTVHEVLALWHDMKSPGPLWQRLRHLWMPPEWQRPPQLQAGRVLQA